VTYQAVSLARPPLLSFCHQEGTDAFKLSAELYVCNPVWDREMFASRVNITKIIKLKYILLIKFKDTGKDDPNRVTKTL
jgi:hypothetical protein